jgi:tetratricopeptide (TPR) repeat protein
MCVALRAGTTNDRAAFDQAMDQALSRAPRSVLVRCAGALVDVALGPGQRASRWCDEAVALSSTESTLALARSTLASLGVRVGWLREARGALEGALRAGDGQARRDLVRLLRGGWSFDAALGHQRALGGGAEAVLEEVDLLVALGRDDEAAAALAGLPPSAPVARRFMDLRRYEDGERVLLAALALAPGSAAGLALGAWFAMTRRDLDAATAHAGALLALDGDDPVGLRASGAVACLRGDVPEALRLLERAVARSPSDPEAHAWHADALLRVGRFEEALAAAIRAGERSPEFSQYVAAQALRYRAEVALGRFKTFPQDAFVEALRSLVPGRERALASARPRAPKAPLDPVALRRSLGELFDTTLASLGGGLPIVRVRGALALLAAGRAEAALTEATRLLARAADRPQRLAVEATRGKILLALGRFEGLRCGEFVDALRELVPGHAETIDAALIDRPSGDESDEAAVTALLDAAISALGGNRSFEPVFVRDGRFVTLPVGASPRAEAKRALWRVVVDDEPATRAALDRVIARYPGRAEPHLYAGELGLWSGDWPAARRAFEAALRCDPHARWAHIGMGATALCAGDARGALRTFDLGERRAGGPGPTLYVYRGEARWRIGDLVGARRDLETACLRNPTRVAARMLLALVAFDQGDRVAAWAATGRALSDAPGLAADAANEAGLSLPAAGAAPPGEDLVRALFGRALAMMRGNRSSNYVTYFLADGRMRVALRPAAAGSGREVGDLAVKAQAGFRHALGL